MKPFMAKATLKEVKLFWHFLGGAIYEDYEIPAMEVAVTEEPVPYSERTGLVYRPVKIGDRWSDKLFQCGWLHVTGNLPPVRAGRTQVLRLDVSGEGCVFDRTGTPVRGLTTVSSAFDRTCGNPKKTTVFLDELEFPEGKLDLWIELGNNDLFGNHNGGVILQCATGYLNEELRAYYYDIDFLVNYLDAIEDTNPQYYAILYALGDSIAMVSSEYRDEDIVRARAALQEQLSKKNGANFLTVSAIGHAHLDLAWLWPIRETKRKAGRTFATVMRNMERYPSYLFGGSQAQQFAWVEELYPNLFAEVQKRVEEGRFEVQGGMWVEPDTNITGGESLVRQFLYGKRYFREKFHKDIRVCWLPDTFGYSGALPQIIKKCGMDYFLTIKMSWSEHFKLPHHTFRWQGIDGSEVLVHIPPEENYNSSACPQMILKTQRNFAERGKIDTAILLYGIGDGGGGPGRDHLERIGRARNFAGLPEVKQQFAIQALDHIAESKDKLAVWKNEMYLARHQGTLTSASDNKKYNRLMETALSSAEKASVIAFLLCGKEYRKRDLERIWKETLLYQFHDILPGSSIRRVYEECIPRYRAMLGEVREIQSESAASLGSELSVFNPDCFARTETVTVNGKCYTVCAAPLAYTPLTKLYAGSGAVATENVLENGALKAEFSEDGSFTLTDKRTGKACVTEGNVLKIYNEFLDCWDMSANFKDYAAGRMALVSRSHFRVADGAVIKQEFRYQNSTLWQEVVLKDDGEILDFKCRIDWQETKKMLRAEFSPVDWADKAVCDIQFGSIERPTHSGTEEQFGMYEVSMHKYVDVSIQERGVAFFNDCKYAVNVKDGVVSINLLRSQMYPCVDCDKGEHEFSYAVYPHRGNRYQSDVVRRSIAYNHPLEVMQAAATKPLFLLDGNDVIIDTVKLSEDGEDVIVRLYECNGRRSTVNLTSSVPFDSAFECNLLEEEGEACALQDGRVALSFTPFEIKTVKFGRKQ